MERILCAACGGENPSTNIVCGICNSRLSINAPAEPPQPKSTAVPPPVSKVVPGGGNAAEPRRPAAAAAPTHASVGAQEGSTWISDGVQGPPGDEPTGTTNAPTADAPQPADRSPSYPVPQEPLRGAARDVLSLGWQAVLVGAGITVFAAMGCIILVWP